MRLRRSPYIPIRNDSQVVSSNELSFVQAALTTPSSLKLRLDGRSLTQLRPARLQLTRAANTGDAACTVTWGSSIQVSCVCQASIVAPSADRPNEGVVQVSVETSPMASTGFVHGPAVGTVSESSSGGNIPRTTLDDAQKAVSNSILRQLENLLQSCLEVEALVIVPGQWVWQLSLRLTVLDCGSGTSGLLDASVLATLAALRHYRQPCTTLGDQENRQDSSPSQKETNQAAPGTISLDHKEGTPLPLHHTPLSISFAWLQMDESDGAGRSTNEQQMIDADDELENIVVLVDPSWQEQKVCSPNELTLQLSIHGEVCGMVSRGAVTPALLQKCHDLASGSLIPQLSQSLETTLNQANAQAVQEGLQRMKRQLQQKQRQQENLAGDEMDVDMTDPDGADKIKDALQAAEESYRKQALEYNLGHQTVAVRDKKQATVGGGNSRLLQSLLQAVSQQPAPGSETHTGNNMQAPSSTTNASRNNPLEPKSKAPPDTSGVEVLKLKKTTDDADIQFEDTAPKPPPKSIAANLSSDEDEEEEATTQLKTEFDEVAEYNRQELDAEEEEAFWEDNRNINREQGSGKKRGFGPDKIKGGRVMAPPPEVPRDDGKPNLKKKNRQMAKRKQQQMKAMQKKSGAD